MNFLKKLFLNYKSNNHRIITILGIKFKIKDIFAQILKNLSSIKTNLLNINSFLNGIFNNNLRALEQSNYEIKNLILDRATKLYDVVIYNDRNLKGLSDFDKQFVEQFKDQDIKNLYIDLIKGLDKESIEIINLILSRVQLWNNGIRRLPVTDREIIGLKKYACEFESNIVKLSDECWAYNGYLLPENKFISTTFLDEHFINKLDYLDKTKNIIDAGAYIGDSAIILSKYTNAKVYAFEPVKELYNKMLKTLELNTLSNVVPISCGLGDKNETIKIQLNDSSSSCVKSDNKFDLQDIEITTIDDFVQKNDNLQVGLIKADIEGFEINMLKGAINTIKTQKPALLIAIYHSFDDFFLIKKEIESWNLGYSFKIAKPDEYSFYCDTTLIAEVKK